MSAVDGAGMTNKNVPSVSELVDRSLAAYQKARESHNALFAGACPYDFFPGPWSFRPDKLTLTRAEFETEVRRFEDALAREDPGSAAASWNPKEVVLSVGHVLILYEPDPPGRKTRLFQVADLHSEDGGPFTAGDLLYAFYQAAAADLRDSCHCHFEGLQFRGVASSSEGYVPIYQAMMGS